MKVAYMTNKPNQEYKAINEKIDKKSKTNI